MRGETGQAGQGHGRVDCHRNAQGGREHVPPLGVAQLAAVLDRQLLDAPDHRGGEKAGGLSTGIYGLKESRWKFEQRESDPIERRWINSST